MLGVISVTPVTVSQSAMISSRASHRHGVTMQGRRMKLSSQKREHIIIVPGGLLAPGPHADPGCSVPAHEVDGDLVQDGQVASRRAIPDAALPEGDIEHPMEPVFYVPADRLNQHCRIITAA